MSDILGDLLVSIPESTANLQLPDPALRQFYKDEQDRIFWVDSQIDENTLDLVKMIIQCNREDKGVPIHTRKPITIMIDSPGGSVDVLLAVIKAIDISKTLARHYEVYAPMFIDRAESVNKFIPSNAQMIYLRVTEDSQLNIK